MTALATYVPAQAAAMGFLSRYERNTLKLYTHVIRSLFTWCDSQGLDPLSLERVHLELYRRYLADDKGNAASTVAHALTTIRHFYRSAVTDRYITYSPAEHLNIPKAQRDETRLIGLSRHELSALLAHAEATCPKRWVLVSLMGIMGMRVSEACSLQVESTQLEVQSYRAMTFIGKGSKPATMPLPTPVARAVDAAIGERATGPLLTRQDGAALDRRTAWRWVRSLGKGIGVPNLHPHALRHTMVTLMLNAGVSLRDTQIAARHSDPRQTEKYDRARNNFDRHGSHILAATVAGTR